jgi:hypothetical protein
MRKALAIILAISALLLLLVLAAPRSVVARHGNPTPTPTQTAAVPSATPIPTGTVSSPTPIPTGTAPSPTPTPQPLQIITAGLLSCTNGVCTLGPGNVGTFIAQFVTSSGGQGPTPYTWTRVAGSLPASLSLQNFGVYSALISGTPTTAQTSNFTLQVRDGVGHTAQQAFTLTIDPPLPLVITSGPCCPDGTVGTAYLTNFFADGGVQPYTWSIPSGQLPPGLRLAASPPAGLSGTPTTRGTYTFTVRVTDHAGTHTDEQGSITIR